MTTGSAERTARNARWRERLQGLQRRIETPPPLIASTEFTVTTSLIIGSVPAVLVGSFLCSRAPDKYIRPAITFVILASGLKYVGLGTTALGWVLVSVLAVAFLGWLILFKPWEKGAGAEDEATEVAAA